MTETSAPRLLGGGGEQGRRAIGRHEVLVLDRISGRGPAGLPTPVGGRVPAYATAMGKAMLAMKDHMGDPRSAWLPEQRDQLPGPLRAVSDWLPLTNAVELVRPMFMDRWPAQPLRHLLVLAGSACHFIFIARHVAPAGLSRRRGSSAATIAGRAAQDPVRNGPRGAPACSGRRVRVRVPRGRSCGA